MTDNYFSEREFLATDPIIMTQEIKKLKVVIVQMDKKIADIQGDKNELKDRLLKLENENSELKNRVEEVVTKIESMISNTIPDVPPVPPVQCSSTDSTDDTSANIPNIHDTKFDAINKDKVIPAKKKNKKRRRYSNLNMVEDQRFQTFNAKEPKPKEPKEEPWKVVERKKQNSKRIPFKNDGDFPQLHTRKSAMPAASNPMLPKSPKSISTNFIPQTSPPSKAKTFSTPVHVYVDSNHSATPDLIIEVNRKLKELNRSNECYSIETHRTFTLRKTLEEVRQRSHKDSIVIINIMTNDAKFGRDIYETQHILRKIIQKLKTETDSQNICVTESAPSTKFNIEPYNKASQLLCKRENVGFTSTLVAKSHIIRDGIHIQHNFRHLLVKTSAAAILGVDLFKTYGLKKSVRNHGYPAAHNEISPSSRHLPIVPMLSSDYSIHRSAVPSFRNVTVAPPFFFKRATLPPSRFFNQSW